MKRWKRNYYTDAQKAFMWDRWQKGESLKDIARIFDRGHSAISGILSVTAWGGSQAWAQGPGRGGGMGGMNCHGMGGMNSRPGMGMGGRPGMEMGGMPGMGGRPGMGMPGMGVRPGMGMPGMAMQGMGGMGMNNMAMGYRGR